MALTALDQLTEKLPVIFKVDTKLLRNRLPQRDVLMMT